MYVGVVQKAPVDFSTYRQTQDNGRTIHTADAFEDASEVNDYTSPDYQLRAETEGLGGKKPFAQVVAGQAGKTPIGTSTVDQSFGEPTNIRGKATFSRVDARPGFKLDDEEAGNLAADNVYVDEEDRRRGVGSDMYDLMTHIGEQKNMNLVESQNQTDDGKKFWSKSGQEGQWRIKRSEPMNISFQLLKRQTKLPESVTQGASVATRPIGDWFKPPTPTKPVNNTQGTSQTSLDDFSKAKSYIQDRPKRLAQAKVQRLSRKVKNARTQHRYKRNLARGAIRPKMRTQTGLIRVTRSR